ncbi:hypothetical protein [Bacillus solimangrovi]|uniref:Type I-B CRISPR-associated protein Cas8b1/Cst1 n=1 Tax=Bacillus solimangrovi TaxID=1305675 RepID=A0A1E5LG22_9BACI|nr:hypothetical protein [Bacillus solimangrovi]OEH93020.1 hypothetical protein BFG57_13775 [Bacillus solimangrovi]
MASSHIDLHAEDWMMTAGLIGLKRIYGEDELEIIPTGIRLYSEQLSSLSKNYFDYFIETYDVAIRDTERLTRQLNKATHNSERYKDAHKEILKVMKEQFKKVEKYFPESKEHHDFKQLIEQMKKLKSVDLLDELRESINTFQMILSTPEINNKLTLNYAKAVIISPFFGQPSFLQAACNSLTKEQHIEKMYIDYVKPVELELQFQERLQNATDAKEILQFLEANKEYKPFNTWFRQIKKLKTVEEIQSYFKNEILPCSFVDGLYSTMSYEEMMFSPLGVSVDKASNFYWDFNKKEPVPMSALARLTLFMIPAGLAFYQRKFGVGQSTEYLRFSGLVMKDDLFEDNVNVNYRYQALRQTGSSFDKVIFGLLEDAKEKSKRSAESYLFVELYSSYKTKKTLLDYYHMPTYVSKYFQSKGNVIKNLQILEHRDNFVRSILKGIDPKQTVFSYLREAIASPRHAYGAFIAVQERYRLTLMKNGVDDVEKLDNRDKRVFVAYSQGKELRDVMVRSRNEKGEEGPYRASGRKKIEGIAYRLLNSTKAGNKHAFLDTVFRLHVAAGKQVSSIFLDTLKDKEGLDFETISGAFLAGLLGEDRKEVENRGNQ